MAEEKSKDEMIEDAALKVEFGYNKHPSPRKYKKEQPWDEDWEKTVTVGTKVIVRVGDSRDVAGYMLAEVVDIDDTERYWSTRSTFIVRILEVSNDALKDHIGHLRVTEVERKYSWGGGRYIVEIGKGNWANYLPSAS